MMSLLKKMIFIVFLSLFACNSVKIEEKTADDNIEDEVTTDHFVVAYLAVDDYKTNTIRWHAITHLNLAFLYPNKDGSLSDEKLHNKISEIVKEAHLNKVKVIVSIKDRETGQFAEAITNNPSVLADNLIKYVEANNLDGFDIDFEDWSSEDAAQHLLSFVKELSRKKSMNMIQSCAVNAYDNGYTTEWHRYFDIINIMAYDWHGPWNTEGQHSPFDKSTAAVEFWNKEMEAPLSKLTLGVPFYGYSWNDGDPPGYAYRYYQILAMYPDRDIANNDRVDNIYYNGKKTIIEKAKWVKKNKAGGIMIWQIGQDAKNDDDSLLDAIGKIILTNDLNYLSSPNILP